MRVVWRGGKRCSTRSARLPATRVPGDVAPSCAIPELEHIVERQELPGHRSPAPETGKSHDAADRLRRRPADAEPGAHRLSLRRHGARGIERLVRTEHAVVQHGFEATRHALASGEGLSSQCQIGGEVIEDPGPGLAGTAARELGLVDVEDLIRVASAPRFPHCPPQGAHAEDDREDRDEEKRGGLGELGAAERDRREEQSSARWRGEIAPEGVGRGEHRESRRDVGGDKRA
jgi:hypothetical protein